MLDVNQILTLHVKNITEWHTLLVPMEQELPWRFVEENNMWNFKLWHEEDIARIRDIDPLRIVEAKRNIDIYNQARNNAMEKIDEWVLSYLATQGVEANGSLHSETPGMMIDRLSIMALKRYHMQEETQRPDASDEHRAKCEQRVGVLNEQIQDLSQCLRMVLNQLEAGVLQFKVYRQFKMYNDPSLNPQLYSRKTSHAESK